jgi:16S rRNA (guanine527-N7)-methyltransferase
MNAVASAPRTVNETLESGVRALGLALPTNAITAIHAYLALLAKWNKTYNLTAIREPGQMVVQHALDALAVVPHLPDRSDLTILDVGAGGGIPGVLLAIARPDCQVTLLDVVQKKAAFLTQVAIELRLANIHVAVSRVEDYAPAKRFDIVVSRAFSDLATFVNASAHLLAAGGQWFAMKGVSPADEIAALPSTVRVVANIPLSVPGLDAARHLIQLEPDNG